MPFPAQPTTQKAGAAADVNMGFHDNPLLTAANPLLNMLARIRHLAADVESGQLRQQLIDAVRRFEVRGQKAQIPHDTLIAARYCLCTVLDEAASLTAWGHSSVWSRSGLLVTFHNETWGGEKFFQILARLSRSPREYLHLLELMNYCLLLGFEGRYRITDNGPSQLETLKQRLVQLIRSVRGAYAPPLSPQAVDHAVPPAKWRPMLPLWVFGLLLALLAGLYFTALDWSLNNASRPILASIYGVGLPGIDFRRAPAQGNHTLGDRLQAEVSEGYLSVREDDRQATVIIRGDALFESGSAELRAPFRALIQRVAEALNAVPGDVIVRGFSDSDPITSGRYASNTELSLARAEAIKAMLQKSLLRQDRIGAQGRGEADPVAPNTSAAGKALNRRVEITLLPSSGHGSSDTSWSSR
jgi:type VI secretion system protein ImpK